MTILGIDIGGTKVALGLMDEHGHLLRRYRFPHRRTVTEDWLQELFTETDAFLQGTHPDAIGIGARGHVDYRRQLLMSATNMLLTEPLDLCSPLSARYGCPAIMDNDAKAAATRELCFGIGQCCDSFVCYAIGTGIGSCVVMDRRILRGDHNFSGEVGYDLLTADREDSVLPYGDHPSFLENLAGGAGLQQAWHGTVPAKDTELFAAAANGNTEADRLISRAVRLIAADLYNLHNLLDIGHFVFSGGLSGAPDFITRIEQETRLLIEHRPGPKELFFSLSTAGSDDAGVVGAACAALYRLGIQS